MMKKVLVLTYIFLCAFTAACSTGGSAVRCGADRLDQYLPLIEGRQIALVANHSSLVGKQHLVDTLLAVAFSQELFGQVAGLTFGDHPADDVAAEDIQNNIEVEELPGGRSSELGDVPGP